MPWTSMHYVIVALLLIIAALVLVVIRLLDGLHEHRITRGAQPLPTARQRRQWRRERLELATEDHTNRRRAS